MMPSLPTGPRWYDGPPPTTQEDVARFVERATRHIDQLETVIRDLRDRIKYWEEHPVVPRTEQLFADPRVLMCQITVYGDSTPARIEGWYLPYYQLTSADIRLLERWGRRHCQDNNNDGYWMAVEDIKLKGTPVANPLQPDQAVELTYVHIYQDIP